MTGLGAGEMERVGSSRDDGEAAAIRPASRPGGEPVNASATAVERMMRSARVPKTRSGAFRFASRIRRRMVGFSMRSMAVRRYDPGVVSGHGWDVGGPTPRRPGRKARDDRRAASTPWRRLPRDARATKRVPTPLLRPRSMLDDQP